MFTKLKNKFLNECLAPKIKKLAGIDSFQNTVIYFFNSYFDIASCKKATGNLRKLQIGNAKLLRIFDLICKKYKLRYFLDYGTLLGCVRHKGFIPWDDDMDVGMPFEDYLKFIEVAPIEFSKYPELGVEYSADRELLYGYYFLTIWEAGLNLDIFPIDIIEDNSENLRMLSENAKKYIKFANKKSLSHSAEEFIKSSTNGIVRADGEGSLCVSLTGYEKQFETPYEKLFPTKQMEFEGYIFEVPAEPEEYLRRYYGDYMSFPKYGILHPNGLNGNIEKYNYDIDALLDKLDEVYEKMKSE